MEQNVAVDAQSKMFTQRSNLDTARRRQHEVFEVPTSRTPSSTCFTRPPSFSRLTARHPTRGKEPQLLVITRSPFTCENAASMLVFRATPSTSESQHQGLFSPVKAHATSLWSDCLCWPVALANDGKQRAITTPNTNAKWCPCQTTTDRHHSVCSHM